MTVSPSKLNLFLLFKLPAAFFTGVRVKTLNTEHCVVTVKHRWINQNPFKSLFWAVQGMAAELTTGALVMQKIKASGKNISMLVATNNARFSKKATGKITFVCQDGSKIDEVLERTINTGEGQTLWMHAVGTNSDNDVVSEFNFEWTLKLKKS